MTDLLQTIFGMNAGSFPGTELIDSFFSYLKWIFIILDVVLIALTALAFRRAWAMRPKLEIDTVSGGPDFNFRTAVNVKRWRAVVARAATNSPDSLRIAVIDADALVNDVLKQMGLEGQHMADRLMRLDPQEITTLNRLWRAHRTRNDLVHTPGFFLAPADAQSCLRDFQAFLNEVKAI